MTTQLAQLDLFGAPTADPDPTPVVARYQRYSMKDLRHVCAHCHLARLDAEKAGRTLPPMQPAAWRRQCGGLETVQLLCYGHKAIAHAEDAAAGRLAKQLPARREWVSS